MCVTCCFVQPPSRLRLPSAIRHPVYGLSGGSTGHVLRVRAAGRCRSLARDGSFFVNRIPKIRQQRPDKHPDTLMPRRFAVKIERSRNFLATTIAADFSWALIQIRSSVRFFDFLHLDQPGKRASFFKMHKICFFCILSFDMCKC